MANTIGQLDSTFTNLISNLMTLESQPLVSLNSKRDDLSVKKAVYTDLKDKLDALQTAIRTLKPSDAFFSLNPGRKVSVSSNTTGSTIATAAAGSTSVPGTYTISEVTLAKSHSVMSSRQTYTDQALGYSGSIVMGGYDAREITASSTNTVVDAITVGSSILSGQQELGTDNYYVETRELNGVQQFRLVNEDGKAMSIRNGTTSSVTANWQKLPTAGEFDTGRGLVLNFTGNFAANMKDNGAASVSYNAQGAAIDIAESDSLVEIASKINNAKYATGNEVTASIIDKQLILTAKNSGSGKEIISSGSVLEDLGILNGGVYTNVQSTPSDASFKVNGMSITRSSNTGLTDVINGVTLNLTSDAEGDGKVATITITGDTTAQKTSIQDFISKFNSLQSYITEKMAVTKNTDGTYTRATLAGDSMLSSLKTDLGRMLTTTYTNSGTLSSLRQIGITMDESGQLTISDSTKLDNALSTDYNNTKLLLDAVMTGVMNKINRYTGTSSYVDTAIKAVEREADNINDQITSMNERLEKKEAQLYDQFAAAQTTLESLEYQQQAIAAGMSYLSGIYS